MKLHTDDEITIGSNNGNKSKFRIAESAKAFKILSSNLYKHKIRAVIRELACNACDAHILAGHKDNFEIVLPTTLDPRFIVRDFGPGLSHEDVMNLYTTYFASTKANSNDFIGALGLGSKSPFSYTETFSIVSTHGGQSRGYVAFLDNGEPNIQETFCEDAGETPNGVEIIVPAKESDLNKFQDEAKYLFRAFVDIKPTVKNLRGEINLFPEDETFSGSYGYESYGFYAIMGNIVYPIQDEVAKNSYLRAQGGCHYFRFPLGELDITPSREELSLDETTIENIEKRVTKNDMIAAENLIAKLQAITNPRTLVLEYLSHNSSVRAWIKNSVQHPVVQEYDGWASMSNTFDTACIEIKQPYYYLCNEPKMQKAKRDTYYSSSTSPKGLTGIRNKTIKVIIDDKPSKRVQLVRGLFAQGHTGNVFIVDETDDGKKTLANMRKLYPGDLCEVFRTTECEDIIKAAPPPVKKKPDEDRPKYSNVQALRFVKGTWEEEDLFLSAREVRELKGYAIGRSRDDFGNMGVTLTATRWDLQEIALKLGVKKLFVMRPPSMKYAVESKLVDLYTKIKSRYIELIDIVEPEQYGFSSSNVFLNRAQSNGIKEIENVLSGGKVTEEYRLLKRIRDLYWRTGDDTDIQTCSRIFNTLQEQSNLKVEERVEEFKKKHPTVYYYMCSSYSLPNNVIEDIKHIISH